MIWKNFVSLLPIAPRRRVIATAIVYGLSLAVRFTSATGEEVEIPAQGLQSANHTASIMIDDGAQLLNNWPLKPAQPTGSPRWLLGSRSCRGACESPMAPPNCSSPP
jgi:hypothetical protein